MGDDAGDRPSEQGVFRGKRSASRSEATCVRGIGTRSLEHQLHGFAHDYAVHRRFSCEEAGLAALVVVGDCPVQVQARSATDHGRESVVAKTAAVGHRGVSEMPHDVLIARHQADGANSQGQEPIFVLDMWMEGAGPNRFLIGEEIVGEECRAETDCRSRSMFLSGTGSRRLRRMAVFSFLPRTFLPRTVARAGFESFCIGCPAGVYQRTNQHSNCYRPANLPPEFVEARHA